MTDTTSRTTISLPEDMLIEVEDMAHANKRAKTGLKSSSAIVRKALEDYLAKDEDPLKDFDIPAIAASMITPDGPVIGELEKGEITDEVYYMALNNLFIDPLFPLNKECLINAVTIALTEYLD